MHKQNVRDIKLFGFVFTILLSLLSIKLFKSGIQFYKNIIGIAFIFFISSLFIPRIISPIIKIFNLFGNFIGWLVTNTILILIFYLVITPTGIFLSLINKDLLKLKETNNNTYWIKKQEALEISKYTKQF